MAAFERAGGAVCEQHRRAVSAFAEGEAGEDALQALLAALRVSCSLLLCANEWHREAAVGVVLRKELRRVSLSEAVASLHVFVCVLVVWDEV